MNLVYVCVLVCICGSFFPLSALADKMFTKCKSQSECVNNYCRKIEGIADLGNCYEGLCKCYNEEGEGEEPETETEEECKVCKLKTDGVCKKACNDASTKNVVDEEAYMCKDKCFCKFTLKGVKKCSADSECVDKQKNCDGKTGSQLSKCNMENKSKRCQTGTASCDFIKGTCECIVSKSQVGTLDSELCRKEKYCSGLCAAKPSPSPTESEGLLCFKKSDTEQENGYCFCPNKEAVEDA